MTTTLRKYSVREGFHISVEAANIIGPALEEIGKGREFTEIPAEEIVEKGSRKNSPLRPYLLYDKSDKELAYQTRLERARYLCRALQVRIEVVGRTEPVPVRAFVSMSSGEPGRRVYAVVQEVAKNKDRRKEVLAEARADMDRWISRYENFLRALGILSRAREIVEVLEKELERASEENTAGCDIA